MSNWILKEEPAFPFSYSVLIGTGAAEADYSILLRKIPKSDNYFYKKFSNHKYI
jgi:hypothetical protein